METLPLSLDWHSWLPALQSPAGALVFIPLYALWVTLLLPGVWASMLAGALYGTWWGSLIVFVGACLGAAGYRGLIARHLTGATPATKDAEPAIDGKPRTS